MSRPELTETQKNWVKYLQSDFDDLPIGVAEGLVRLYMDKPDFFTKENFEKMKDEPVEWLTKTQGTMEIMTPEEVEKLEARIKESSLRAQQESETVSDRTPELIETLG